MHRFPMVGRGAQTPVAGGDGFGEQRFLDRGFSFVDVANFFRVNIHAEHVETAGSQCGGDAASEFAQTEYRDSLKMLHQSGYGN